MNEPERVSISAVNGTVKNSPPHILSIHLKGIPAEEMLIHMDLAKIAVSTGHCRICRIMWDPSTCAHSII
ncbi:MAG: hypothetical protein U5K84_01255 [Alkalibacterium sp.]|nr:hypothetical protein [Alkalibacterium sp.]